MTKLSRRVDDLVDAGVPVGEAIAQAIGESMHKND